MSLLVGLLQLANGSLADVTPPQTSPPVLVDPSRLRVGAQSEPEWRAIRGGAVLFGGAYALSLAGAASERFDGSARWLPIPVAGPWLALGSGLSPWALVMAGPAQAAGAGLILWGIVSPRRVLGPPVASLAVTASPGLRLDLRF